ncbi:hypothetical protein ESZ50_09320 [Weissella muntiaci]|uniref:WxL domain-containing protein n=1 Tax=Weissella muntiaci TaxID=2508881 RepID=A0A6C2C2D5_9LACO|nr:L-type lectin-domain containing protein [Weissella muntiaci]TYC48171.1 hypothetical protein ESZ50_09320 [Weissella muntiaci]
MRYQNILRRSVIFTVVMSVFSGIVITPLLSVVHADDYSTALSTTPQGIKLTNVFTPASFSGNSAQVVAATNPNVTNTDVVRVTSGQANQMGAIWATDNNLFDLTKSATVSMWLNFGNQGKNAADGMALVFKNDDKGADSIGQSGQALGVWGTDAHTSKASDVSAKAIQNSWAIEFDPYLNTANDATKGAASFDLNNGLSGAHIASNYPGNSNTYRQHSSGFIFKDYWYDIEHKGIIDNLNLSNGNWHHFTLKWNATTSEMTYTFDDKDPNTSAALTGQSQTIVLDKTQFKTTTNQIRWGFTGATGLLFENGLVVFEQVPGLVNATASATIKNDTRNIAVNSGTNIYDGDQLTYTYNLNYASGKQNWTAIVAQMQMATTGIDYKSGTITYANGGSENVDLSSIKNGEFSQKLKNDLSTANNSATIVIKGQANNKTGTTIKVADETSDFAGSNYMVSATTPTFNILPNPNLTLAVNPSSVDVTPGNDATTTGTLTYGVAGNVVTNSQMNLKATLNGTAATIGTDVKIAWQGSATSGQFIATVPSDKLVLGNNSLVLTATDANGFSSNSVTVPIRNVGELKLTSKSDSSFKSTVLTGLSTLIQRNGDWGLSVSDTRGPGNKWQLQASATTLKTATGTQLAGGLVYVTNSNVQQNMTNAAVNIMSQTTTSTNTNTDVLSSWKSNQGILLNANASALNGNYSGKISWTLMNVPTP